MTKTIKFDETDRKNVIREIQEHLGVQLSPVGKRRKWLRDGQGRNYWVLGGSAEWHGIPEVMMDAEANEPTGGTLVVTNRKREALQIFAGPLDPIVRNRSKLSRAMTTTRDYQFTITTRGSRLHINQVPGAALRELANVAYTKDDKAKDQNLQAADRILERGFPELSPEERKRILETVTKGE